MKLETILDAMSGAQGDMYQWYALKQTTRYNQRKRQYRAFRDRIIRMDAEKDKIIGRIAIELHHKDAELWNKDQRIAELEQDYENLRRYAEDTSNTNKDLIEEIQRLNDHAVRDIETGVRTCPGGQ